MIYTELFRWNLKLSFLSLKNPKTLILSPVKQICVFEHSVMTNFNCACPAIQRGQRSGFLSEGSSWLTACMSEQRRFWRDCTDASLLGYAISTKFAWGGPFSFLFAWDWNFIEMSFAKVRPSKSSGDIFVSIKLYSVGSTCTTLDVMWDDKTCLCYMWTTKAQISCAPHSLISAFLVCCQDSIIPLLV